MVTIEAAAARVRGKDVWPGPEVPRFVLLLMCPAFQRNGTRYCDCNGLFRAHPVSFLPYLAVEAAPDEDHLVHTLLLRLPGLFCRAVADGLMHALEHEFRAAVALRAQGKAK